MACCRLFRSSNNEPCSRLPIWRHSCSVGPRLLYFWNPERKESLGLQTNLGLLLIYGKIGHGEKYVSSVSRRNVDQFCETNESICISKFSTGGESIDTDSIHRCHQCYPCVDIWGLCEKAEIRGSGKKTDECFHCMGADTSKEHLAFLSGYSKPRNQWTTWNYLEGAQSVRKKNSFWCGETTPWASSTGISGVPVSAEEESGSYGLQATGSRLWSIKKWVFL